MGELAPRRLIVKCEENPWEETYTFLLSSFWFHPLSRQLDYAICTSYNKKRKTKR